MQTKDILISLIIIGTFICGSCKKNNNDAIGNVFLRDKPLAEIKSLVQGNWKIHYKYGGITGNIKTPMTDSYFKVLQTDSIYLTFSNTLFAADIATFQRVNTTFGYSAYTMDFESIGGTPKTWIVDYIINDTLVLDDDYANGSAYFMTRIP